MKYSVVIITKNEATNIADCIKSVKNANEVVVIDDESSDNTTAIAKRFGVKVYKRKLDGFASQKNFGILKTNNTWVLVLDADERLTPELANEIIKLYPKKGVVAYDIAFRNYLGQKWLRYGGLYPDRHIRLFNKKHAKYGKQEVHETLVVNGNISHLKYDIIHLTYKNVRDYFNKVKKYSALEAKWHKEKPSWWLILKTFYRKYIKDRGYKDDWSGLISAILLTYYQFNVLRHWRK